MSDSKTVNTSDRLSFTAFLALAFHALLLFGISFTIDVGEVIAPTLNITLATYQSEEAPERAKFIAQHDQLASGTTDETQELLAQHRADIAAPEIREVNPPPQVASQQASKREIDQITTNNNSKFKLAQKVDENEDENQEEKKAQEQDIPDSSPDKAALQAKIDRLKQKDAERPRIRRMTSVSTRSSKDAEYLNNWNMRIEQVGNNNFPQAAIQNRIFGELIIAVTLNANGTIHNLKVVEPSRHQLLNQSAVQIIRLAAPFNPIPTEVMDGHDKLEIIRTWKFEITGLKSTGA